MDILTPKESCEIEISRFFKKYYTFTSSSESDDLNNLLNSLCSSIEKLELATGVIVSKDNKRYLSLKALRNYALHKSELLNDSKGIKSQDMGNVRAELSILCLLPVKVVENVIDKTPTDQTKRYIREVFNFYENYVDIYPAIFNFAVDIYFLVQEHSLNISGDGFNEMKSSIQYEIDNCFSHHISGRIITLTGIPVSEYIDNYVISMDERIAEESKFLSQSTRMAKLGSSPLEQLSKLSNADKKFIFKDLISTKAVEIHDSPKGKFFTENRPLSPVEWLVMQQLLKRK